jgi:hypothetical protein
MSGNHGNTGLKLNMHIIQFSRLYAAPILNLTPSLFIAGVQFEQLKLSL